ncbi:flavin reductase family protein [Streptomyces sp. NPDC050516]|uniref:flavin reductase family protein n=1 Tax=Streptomyces sp. NPDC050516 TaxID=3365621 RepID=UPI0037BB345D
MDAETFRAAMARIAGPVAVVTVRDPDGVPYGMTVSSLCSLSLRPPLVLFCVAATASCHPVLRTARRWCVSVLAAGQEDVARRFAAKGEDRFAGPGLDAFGGLPAVRGSLARLLCGYEQVVPAGDHSMVVGRVLEAQLPLVDAPLRLPEAQLDAIGGPLLYHARGYRSLAPAAAHEALSAPRGAPLPTG